MQTDTPTSGYGHDPDGCPVCALIPAQVVARNTRPENR